MAYVDTSNGDSLAAVHAATDDVGADVVIVACSSDAAQEQAMEMAAPRGRVLFFGGLPKGTTHINFPSNVLHYREVQVHGSYASRHRDQVHALDMLADDIGGLRAVVSDVVDLEDAPAAFGRIRAGEVLKVVVEPAR
jgi:L-iditol 2-dehydrogenase